MSPPRSRDELPSCQNPPAWDVQSTDIRTATNACKIPAIIKPYSPCLGQLPKLSTHHRSTRISSEHRSNSPSFQNHLTSASSTFPQTIVALYQTSRTPVAARKHASQCTTAPKLETEKLLPRLFQAFQCTHDRCVGRLVWFRRLLNGSLRG